MKNFLLLILFAFTFTVAANAQYTTPRTGTGANNDNTYRALTFKFVAATDVAGADTVKLNLNGYNNHVKVVLVDSLCFTFPSVTKCYVGDVLKFTITGATSGNKIKFSGSNYTAASSSVAISTIKKGQISFIFDGASWVEVCRATY